MNPHVLGDRSTLLLLLVLLKKANNRRMDTYITYCREHCRPRLQFKNGFSTGKPIPELTPTDIATYIRLRHAFHRI